MLRDGCVDGREGGGDDVLGGVLSDNTLFASVDSVLDQLVSSPVLSDIDVVANVSDIIDDVIG